jgi:hypothetical protein
MLIETQEQNFGWEEVQASDVECDLTLIAVTAV